MSETVFSSTDGGGSTVELYRWPGDTLRIACDHNDGTPSVGVTVSLPVLEALVAAARGDRSPELPVAARSHKDCGHPTSGPEGVRARAACRAAGRDLADPDQSTRTAAGVSILVVPAGTVPHARGTSAATARADLVIDTAGRVLKSKNGDQ